MTLAVLTGLASGPARAQVLLLPEEDAPSVFPVGALELAYAQDHADQPPLEPLLPIEVELSETEAGWAAPRAGEPTRVLSIGGPDSPSRILTTSGLARLLRAIVAALNAEGLYGVDVRPAPSDIDVERELDRRPASRDQLAVIVTVGRIDRIRTIAVGNRVRDDWKIDNEIHTRIRERSPLQPTGVAKGDQTDLLDRRALEDYLHRLNRHSGRRVEAALSPASEPGGIVLDYRVLEAKPWYVYGQSTNTGTSRTNAWQTRLGAAHRQLTDRDDILTIEYLNAGLDDVNSVRVRYQAPFFGPERPDWMNRRRGDPEWLEWIPREKIPWWGVDRMRWEADFRYGRARAGRSTTLLGLQNDAVNSEQYRFSGRLIYELFQYRDLFVDVYTGLRMRDVDVTNRTSGTNGDAFFFQPVFGFHADRIRQISTFGLDLAVEGGAGSNDEDDLDDLGRDDTDGDWALIEFNLGYSTFLEPLIRPKAWRDPSTELSSTLAHEISFGVRGQYAFDYRLVPQVSQTIGGLFSVRGYDQSLAVGDSVIVGSLEYRFHFPRSLPVQREPIQVPFFGAFRAAPQQVYGRPDWDLLFRAFVDVGRSIRNGSNSNAGATEFDQTLVGMGVGAELSIRSNLRARIDWAAALKGTNGNVNNPTNVGDNELHVLFSILY